MVAGRTAARLAGPTRTCLAGPGSLRDSREELQGGLSLQLDISSGLGSLGRGHVHLLAVGTRLQKDTVLRAMGSSWYGYQALWSPSASYPCPRVPCRKPDHSHSVLGSGKVVTVKGQAWGALCQGAPALPGLWAAERQLWAVGHLLNKPCRPAGGGWGGGGRRLRSRTSGQSQNESAFSFPGSRERRETVSDAMGTVA